MLTLVAKGIEAWSSKLRPSSTLGATRSEENSLHRLVAECGVLSKELFHLIWRSIPNDPKSERAVLRAVFADRFHEKEKRQLLDRLKECRHQLTVQLETLDRSELKQLFQSLAEESFEGFASLQTKLDSLHADLKSSVSSDVSAFLQELLNVPSQALAETRILQSMASTSMHQREDQIDEAHFETFRWLVDDTSKSHGLYRRRFNQ
ncbi:hypothetical protein BDV30DRAFT_73118 [Aspergillus minisclerotigenes]|uniref:NACHT-NTPase and P-loop NTPases N-terminal domain-containing protein n=1 Tax=Aspergillus minisclerotigenes TaxID=656917 RepID=A0A5N6JLK6_9EURO|nr:hypothetical protein BDV30DRAFT_73118 [Aspergillus minisclerotigenes]